MNAVSRSLPLVSLSVVLRASTPLLVLAFLLATATASANLWNGDGCTENFSCACNWLEDQVPGACDSAVFDCTSVKDVTFDVNVNIKGVEISEKKGQ